MENKKEHSGVEHKKEDVVEIPVGKYVGNVRKNPWIVSTVVLAVVLILILIFGGIGGGNVTRSTVSAEEAGQKVVNFIKSNPQIGDGVSLVSTEQDGQFYVVTLNYKGDEVPVYATLDGQYLVGNPVSLNQAAQQQNQQQQQQAQQPASVPKSDKPVVEAFVFSYCPYGLQFEKALLPVYEALKDKADIKIVAIGAMHGEFEKTETLRQICIEKEYSKDKLWAYLDKFMVKTEMGACNGNEQCSDPLVNGILSSLQIDKNKINTCMTTDAEAIYQQQNARAGELGISGSPTFVINGAKVQAARSPAAIAQAVCNAFNTAPAECSQQFDSAQATPSFGSGTSAGSAAAAANCGV